MNIRHTIFIFSFVFHWSVYGQNITGTVTDIMGKPLSGANIIWENHTKGTVTDETGAFIIEDIQDSIRILHISFVGFTTEKIDVRTIKHWEVQLIEDATLSEVNITAKGSATRFSDDVAKVEAVSYTHL